MKLIRRDSYLNKLVDIMETPDIKAVTGVRRSGKSALLEFMHNNLLAQGKDLKTSSSTRWGRCASMRSTTTESSTTSQSKRRRIRSTPYLFLDELQE